MSGCKPSAHSPMKFARGDGEGGPWRFRARSVGTRRSTPSAAQPSACSLFSSLPYCFILSMRRRIRAMVPRVSPRSCYLFGRSGRVRCIFMCCRNRPCCTSACHYLACKFLSVLCFSSIFHIFLALSANCFWGEALPSYIRRWSAYAGGVAWLSRGQQYFLSVTGLSLAFRLSVCDVGAATEKRSSCSLFFLAILLSPFRHASMVLRVC